VAAVRTRHICLDDKPPAAAASDMSERHSLRLIRSRWRPVL
jgi:hypothetical protein